MLEKFRAAQAPAVERLQSLEREGRLPAPFAGARPSLAGALRSGGPGALIAEYKRASPSRGDINLEARPEETARAYARAGAAALSVLTERVWFKGDIAYLSRMTEPGLPLLRKDFLIHPLQVAETASTPASALLLIVRMLDNGLLRRMLCSAHEARLEAVLEVFSERDLERARAALAATAAQPAVIQVNNRDLDTLRLDPEISRRLVREREEREVWISASGAAGPEDIAERAQMGFDGVLVGTALMSGGAPGAFRAGRAAERSGE